MKTFLLVALLITFCGFHSFAQNYITGIVGLYGDNTVSGNTTVANGASLYFNKNKLYALRSFVNRGDSTAISADSGTLVLSGRGTQAITGRFKISALQIDNPRGGAEIVNNISPTMVTILDSVSFGNINNSSFDAGDSLMTLRSTISNTARIADLTHNNVNTGNAVNGNVIVERYVRSRRAWHLLCPPTTADSANDQTIQAAWQEGVQAPRGQVVNPNPGYGTYVTRPDGNLPLATGYDDGIAYAATYSVHMYLSNGGYTQPVNTDFTHFSPHAAYILFVRGDRSVAPSLQTDSIHTPSTITTLRSKGSLHNGNVTDTFTNTLGSFAGVSNPYASTIDFSQLSFSGITNGFYTWDPSINLFGGWVYIDGDDNYNATPQTSGGVGAYTDPATNPLIQSGQGFLVKTVASTSTLTFQEQSKNITSRSDVFRLVQLPSISVNLFSAANAFLDGAVALFDASFSKNFLQAEDIAKPVNTNINLGFYADGVNLMKDKWPMPATGDTLPLRLWKIGAGNYRFVFNTNNLTGSPQGYLIDNYLHTSFDIQGSQVNHYDFAIQNDSASKAINRFAIVFGSSVLPVTLSQIKADWVNAEVAVQWDVQNESNTAYYEVERSSDGTVFTKIGTVAAHNNNTLHDTYYFTDSQPLDGDNYYRVKSIDKSGAYHYTGIAKVTAPEGIMTITVLPNPVVNHLVKLLFSHAPAGKYAIILYSSDGKKITGKEVVHPGGTATYTLPARSVAQGLYHVMITGANSKKKTDLPVAIE